MKIARIDTHSVKVPYTFGGSHKGEGLRTWTTNNILLVRVETDSGIVGWGEAFCYACTNAVRAAIQNMIAPIAIGQDARDIARLSYDLQQKLHLFGRYGITIFALSGLDIALWDHRRQGGRPAAATAAGRRRSRQAAGLCQPAEVPRSREGRGPHQACRRRGLPPRQVARDRGARGQGGAAGGGQRHRHHGRHQLPVDARAGAAHDLEAAPVRPALARRTDLPARGLHRHRPPARGHGRSHGRGREQLHLVPVPRHVRRAARSTMRSPASPRSAASRES